MLAELHRGNLPPSELALASAALEKDFPNGIEQCGADALRLTLAAYLQQGVQINMDTNRVVGYRQFGNKIWNLHKFAFQFFEQQPPLANASMGAVQPSSWNELVPLVMYAHANAYTSAGSSSGNGAVAVSHGWEQRFGLELELPQRWVMSRLAQTASSVHDSMSRYELAAAVSTVHHFVLHELCDQYVELAKPSLYALKNGKDGDKERERGAAAAVVLFACLDGSLRMLHPFMPFLTEELWQHLMLRGSSSSSDEEVLSILQTLSPGASGSSSAQNRAHGDESVHHDAWYRQDWELEGWQDTKAEEEMGVVLGVVRAIRNLVHVSKPMFASDDDAGVEAEAVVVEIELRCGDERVVAMLQDRMNHVLSQSRLGGEQVHIVREELAASAGGCLLQAVSFASPVVSGKDNAVTVALKIPSDPETQRKLGKELKRLKKRLAKLQKQHDQLKARTSNENYASRVPAHVQEKDALKLGGFQAEITSTTESMANLQEI
jgi:valyl-tRNA synthetase